MPSIRDQQNRKTVEALFITGRQRLDASLIKSEADNYDFLYSDIELEPELKERASGNLEDMIARVGRNELDSITITGSGISKTDLRALCIKIWETSPSIPINLLHADESGIAKRQIELSDLIGSDLPAVDLNSLQQNISGKRILVTGACGSFGKVLMNRLSELNPAHVTALDHDETELYLLEQSLEFKTGQALFYLADITDQPRMEALFQNRTFDLIIHTAAYKHVPVMERHPIEAARVNVLGTCNIADLAHRFGTPQMITLSTDKAVNPANVMGMTKFLVERMMTSMNEMSQTRFNSVRVGNLLGARGSVVPVMEEQISQEKPVTVTHPEVQRYFISIADAVDHTLDSLCFSDSEDTFLIDMGTTIKIDDLARLLILKKGYRPDQDIPVVYSGLRQGEKMHESLWSESEQQGALPGTSLISIKPQSGADIEVEEYCLHLEKLIQQQDEMGVRTFFKDIQAKIDSNDSAEFVNADYSS